MNRLRDDVGDDPVAARGIELLRGRAATPDDNEMKRRVWGAIQQTRLRAATPTLFYRLRAVAAAVIVLGLAGTAGAMIRQRWIASGRTLAPAPAAVERATTTASRPGPRKVALGTAGADTNENSTTGANTDLDRPQTGPSQASPATQARAKQRALAAAPRRGGDRDGERARGVVKSNIMAATVRERAEVLDAMVALRRDHDAVRAGALLDAYLAAHPRGVLREEALVLAVEAADARGDGTTARRLARVYQTAFPGGRFTLFARERAAAEGP